MATYENAISVLNDLIRINNDRTEGYDKALDELQDLDIDLRTLFERYATESTRFAQELSEAVVELGGDPTDGTTNSGKIYRIWMDVKAAFTGGDRLSVLNACEFGEDAAQRAYETALKEQTELPSSINQLIVDQKAILKQSHDTVKEYRDAEKVAQ